MATVKVTPTLVQQALRETDWAAVDAQTDEDIARHVAEDPDAALILTAAQTAAAIARGVRQRLGISQAEFSARYHVPIGTLRVDLPLAFRSDPLAFQRRGTVNQSRGGDASLGGQSSSVSLVSRRPYWQGRPRPRVASDDPNA
jgi:hypothetical protein